jgi:hypothetical protein
VVTSRRAREPIVMVVVWRMVLRSCWMVMVGVGFVGLWGDFCFFSRANQCTIMLRESHLFRLRRKGTISADWRALTIEEIKCKQSFHCR